MKTRHNRRILLASRPQGEPSEANFRTDEIAVMAPGPGQMLLRTLWLSLDPYMRGRMGESRSYTRNVDLGEVMIGGAVSEVISSELKDFSVGDFVVGFTGWQEYSLSNGLGIERLDPSIGPVRTALGLLGMPSKAAYFGLMTIGMPKPGETLVVSAAAGAVGSIVGQIAKQQGCRVVGVAGGMDKCRHVRDTLGFDEAVDYREPDFHAYLSRACPDGIDIYFDNVGGAVLYAVLPLLNNFARVPVCGDISSHATGRAGPDRGPELMRAILVKRLAVRGFLVGDFADRGAEFHRDMLGWLKEGRLRYREDIVEGLEAAPRAFVGLFRGENFGKLLVRVANPSPHFLAAGEERTKA